jgi:hypothetical protein
VIALLVNPDNANAERVIRDMQDAARTNGLQLHVLKARSESEIDTAFASLVQLHAGALIVAADSFLSSRREQLVALASRQTRRSAGPAADDLRAGHQPPDRQGAGPHGAAIAADARRRGYRVRQASSDLGIRFRPQSTAAGARGVLFHWSGSCP